MVKDTDDVGEDANNLTLSEERAASVKDWLVKKGIDESRLTPVGKGETEPLVPNTGDASRGIFFEVCFYSGY